MDNSNPEIVKILVRDYDNLMFPDTRQEDVNFVAKQKKILDRFQGVTLYAKPE